MEPDTWIRSIALIGGLFLVAAVVLDVAYSTLSARGAGPLLRVTSRHIWRLGRPLARWTSRGTTPWTKRRALFGLAGPMVLLGGLATWMALLWTGWWLVFLGDAEAVLSSQDRTPASWLERLYYAGVSITTLGVGDFVAGQGSWRLLTVAAGLTGFTVLTLGVTFVLTLLGAVAEKRAVADYITALGATPRALTSHPGRLYDHLPSLTAAVSGLAQKYAAYPMLQYYHTTGRNASLALRVAALGEAVFVLGSGGRASTIAEAGAGASARARLLPLERSLQSLAATLHEVHLDQPDDAPPLPAPVRDRVDDPEQFARLEGRTSLRRSLLAFVHWEEWSWDDVHDDPLGGQPSAGDQREA